MADVWTIGGATVDPTTTNFLPVHYRERLGSVPSLQVQARGVTLASITPDPWLGAEITWTCSGTLRFVGDVVSRQMHFSATLGWVADYQCIGLRDRGDHFAFTDANTGTDTSAYNLQPEDPDYVAARAGRTVGQILADVLTFRSNAQNLNAVGIGNYTGLPSAPALPSATTTDLAALTVVVPRPAYVTGEKLLSAVEGFLQQWAPNYRLWVKPDGTIRFLDTRAFTPATLTMGTDPIEPTELSRDVADCFQRVAIRGRPLAEMFIFKLSNGTLAENFAWGSNSNAAAKAAWTTTNFRQAGQALDTGTCTCPTTTTVTVTSSHPTYFWISNFWDQTSTGSKGVLNVWYSAGSGITQQATRRIVSNTSLTAGGTSTLTLDRALPATNFDHYTITGSIANSAAVVWCKYQIVDTAFWPLVTAQCTSPQAVVNGNVGASLMSTAIGVVLWGASPYNTFPVQITYDGAGNVLFAAPTYIIANNAAPADVWAFLPINVDVNNAVQPANSGGGSPNYSGTSYTVEGMTKTLTIDVSAWRDPGQFTQMVAYAADLLDSVKDAVIEGSVTYHGLYAGAMDFGLALNIACDEGGTHTTGWESAAVPVLGCEVSWPNDGATDYVTVMHCSNRRGHYTAEMFLRPERTFDSAVGGDFNPFGGFVPGLDYKAGGETMHAGGSGGAFAGAQSGLGGSDLGALAPDMGGTWGRDGANTAGLPTGAGMGEARDASFRDMNMDSGGNVSGGYEP